MVGAKIRNPAWRLLPLEFPTFPQAIVKKEKVPKRKKTTATAVSLSFELPTENRTIRGERFLANLSPLRGSVLNDSLTTAFGRGYDLSPLRGSIAKRERDSAKP